jgi:hypothetical protein
MCSTLLWLGRALLAVLAVIGLPQLAQADFINLVSQSYEIRGLGEAYGCVPPAGPCSPGPTVDYDLTSDMPMSRTDGVVYTPPGLQGGAFSIKTAAAGGVVPSSAFVQAENTGYDYGNASVGIGEASATITFKPLVPNVFFRAMDPYSSFPRSAYGLAQLYDDTAGVAVFTISHSIADSDVSLDLRHLYTMSVSADFCYCIEDRGVGLTMGAIGPVPESESTLTFLVVGLGALLLVARAHTTFRPAK